eukprot:1914590-Rhodomonas_salina.1
MDEWKAVLSDAKPDEYLKSLGSQSTGVSSGSGVSDEQALNMVAALLEYNKLTTREGFEQFDLDKDGRISLDDLLGSVVQLQLDLSPGD